MLEPEYCGNLVAVFDKSGLTGIITVNNCRYDNNEEKVREMQFYPQIYFNQFLKYPNSLHIMCMFRL